MDSFRVLTLPPIAFRRACVRLAHAALPKLRSIGYPVVLVGIPTGGAYVADAVEEEAAREGLRFSLRADIQVRRPSTATKEKLPLGWLARLPLPILDGLRIAEARLLARKSQHSAYYFKPGKTIELSARLRAFVEQRAGEVTFFVVDDAVDSGRTMLSVVKALRGLHPRAEVVTASLAFTLPRPLIRPDFFLYGPGTLLRFPWSKDYAGVRPGRWTTMQGEPISPDLVLSELGKGDLVAIDLDGTWYAGNTFTDFVRWLLSPASDLGIKGRLEVINAVIKRKTRQWSHQRAKADIIALALRKGIDFDEYAKQALAGIRTDITDFCRRAQERGAKVCLATAAPAEYAIPLSHLLNADYALAAQHGREYRGNSKLQAVEALCCRENLSPASALSDHEEDSPLLEAVRCPVWIS